MSVAPRPDRKASSTAGFTLAETLVGLSLLALVSILLAGGFQFLFRTKDLDQRLRHERQFATARETLSSVFATALPVIVQKAGSGPKSGLIGSAGSVSFVAPGPQSTGGLFNYTLLLDASAISATGSLVLTSSPYVPGTPTTSVPSNSRATLLLDDVTGLALRYFGRPPGVRSETWSDSWEGPALPLLVEIAITRKKSQADRPETIVVKLTQSQRWR